ncbi:MAG: small multi-drug export protein [Mogibacterium sp.]|nr:small multi-drug export protein [Mogibacterium sp.]
MVPVIELRGAIPRGIVAGLDFKTALIVAIIGNLIPVPILVLFTTKVFAWLRTKSEWLNRLVTKLEEKGRSKQGSVEKYKFWGLMLLVAIPLPGTGAWTGCLVAALMEMKLKDAFPAIALGVVLAGLIVTAVTYGVVVAF